ncbi:GNAT family N-acetyltransferase [Microterricola viridarii]|uniref:Protein N-acetyltransferase, RimJ/RimL family n=1 Tax=Microterricola viridarii TaxID=412690 RepID=A0A1H1QPF0_9MICO|nr:GNAT family N-acetyltransferase [Microterricola viridarii]SDS25314.1 Protein N-acetyltransferase, RimJ/RimL family [Microterricola viridarii]
MDIVALRTERLVLDQLQEGDVDAITAYCQDPLFERYLTVPWPYRREHAAGFVNELAPAWWQSGAEATWALRREEGGPLMGVLSFRMPKHDLGFWIGEEHRGFGYMPEAVSRVADWAFDEAVPGLQAVGWECIAGNVASARVARKAGFRFTRTAPSSIPDRDDAHPESWYGTLGRGIRSIHEGWPTGVVQP